MPSVTSSAISRIEWETGTLSIWFHETGRYDYYNVPESEYQSFIRAASIGTYYNSYIRDKY